jgi:hypothetical protein
MIDKSKIAIVSTVINFELYNITSMFFPSEIQKYVIDGREGMHGIDSLLFMMKIFKNKNIDWLIMADEDVIFKKPDLVFELIEEMKSKNYFFSGVRDGGEISHRNYNPLVINTFFSVINLKELYEIWSVSVLRKHQYINKNEFDDDLSSLKFNYDAKSLYEPYYKFYLWLRRNEKKPLFLKTEMFSDAISNIVFFNNQELLYHTWYARSYKINEKHTKRIDVVLSSLPVLKTNSTKPIIYLNSTFKYKKNG